jgi:homoserine dehydrogenase
LVLSGPGAGGDATASAVAGDLCDIAKSKPGHQHAPVFGRPAQDLEPYQRARMRAHEGGYFIRLMLNDRAGAFASIASRMAEENISLESIVQRKKPKSTAKTPENAQPVILITHETTELAISNALEKIQSDGHLAAASQMIRMER